METVCQSETNLVPTGKALAVYTLKQKKLFIEDYFPQYQVWEL